MTLYSVIGAGVAGLAVATELVARGASVQVFDPAGGPGEQGCSWWAGGMLAPWREFENAEEPVLRLCQKAIDWWAARTEVHRKGKLVVANPHDLPDLRRFSRRTDRFNWIKNQEIAQFEPDLGAFQKALYFGEEGHLNPRRALQDLLDQGVSFRKTRAPENLPDAIDCRGFAAREALPDMRGVKGEILVICCLDVALIWPFCLLHPRIPLYIVPRGDRIYMLGATMIESEDRTRITARSMLEMLSAAYALNPAFGEAEVLEIGVDLRPAFADNLPRIRRRDGVVYANGLYRHGYLLAPALAQGVADLVLDNKTPEMVDEDNR